MKKNEKLNISNVAMESVWLLRKTGSRILKSLITINCYFFIFLSVLISGKVFGQTRSVSLIPENFSVAYSGPVTSGVDGIKLSSVGYRNGNRMILKDVFDCVNKDIYVKWYLKSEGGSYIRGIIGLTQTNVNSTQLDIYPRNTWLYSRIRVNSNFTFVMNTCSNNYDNQSGAVEVEIISGVVSEEFRNILKKTSLQFEIADTQDPLAYLHIEEIIVPNETPSKLVEIDKWDFENNIHDSIKTVGGTWVREQGTTPDGNYYLKGTGNGYNLDHLKFKVKDIDLITFNVKINHTKTYRLWIKINDAPFYYLSIYENGTTSYTADWCEVAIPLNASSESEIKLEFHTASYDASYYNAQELYIDNIRFFCKHQFSAGNGTLNNPFQITNASELNSVRNYTGSEFEQTYFQVMNNIDMEEYLSDTGEGYNSGQLWLPIGTYSKRFAGKFDGGGHIITNLKSNRPGGSGVGIGLFGYTANEAQIKRLGIESDNITGLVGGAEIGGITGNNKGTISECYFKGKLTSTGSEEKMYIGGITGYNENGSIINCYAFGTISGNEYIGGIVGFSYGTGIIDRNYAVVSVIGGSSIGTGGIVGELYSGTVSNSFWDKEVTQIQTNNGGIGKTTAEMKSLATFLNSTWDFKGYEGKNTWNIGNNRNNGYPYFNWQFPDDKASQFILFSALSNKTYGDEPFEIIAVSSSGLNVSISNTDSNISEIIENQITIKGSGKDTIIASQIGNEIFNPAMEIKQELVINKKALDVNAVDTSKVYGQENPVFRIQYSGFVYNEDTSVVSVKPVASVSATKTSPVGDYDITLNGGNTQNYNLNLINGKLTINKANLTVRAIDTTRTRGVSNPVFRLQYNGFADGDDISNIDTLPKVTTIANAASNVGQYDIVVSNAKDNNYSFSYLNGILNITKAMLEVRVVDTSRVQGSPNPVFRIEFSGFVNNEDFSVIKTLPTASTTADETSVPGDYTITINGGIDDNYDFTYYNGTLVVLTNTSSNNTLSKPIIVLPNPAINFIKITGEYKAGTIAKLYNSLGNLVMVIQINNQPIDVSNLSHGLYFLKINNEVIKILKK